MPYTFTVNSEVVVHERVSIPASEHSSSKVVTIREPVSIHVTVDDTAFNSSVMACDARIDSVNDSVVDSVRRQSEAKKESAKVISKSVLDGFYKYAASDFRQQMVEHENVVNSTLPKIQTYMAQLQDLKRRMESDYNLISKRYVGIFKGYDEELDRNMHRLYDPLFELYDDCSVSEVYVVYTEYVNSAVQRPVCKRILPLLRRDFGDVEYENKYSAEVLYEPDIQTVFDQMVPQYIIGVIYDIMMQSAASENAARMTAMQNATKNADKMIAELTGQINAARQLAITNEITEIAAASQTQGAV